MFLQTKKSGLRPKSDEVGCHVKLRGVGVEPLPHCSCSDKCCIM